MDLTIRPIQRAEIPAAALILADAFEPDPVVRHLWPNPRHRHRQLPRYFRTVMAHHHVPGGGVEIAADKTGDLVGVALWDPPGRWDTSGPEFARSAPQLAVAFGHRIPAALSTRRRFDRIHPAAPHWYLCNLAVMPAHQRQGIGTALLESRCARCDSAGESAYLVCTLEQNLPLYRGAGFATTATDLELPDGTPLWPMWRDPAIAP